MGGNRRELYDIGLSENLASVWTPIYILCIVVHGFVKSWGVFFCKASRQACNYPELSVSKKFWAKLAEQVKLIKDHPVLRKAPESRQYLPYLQIFGYLQIFAEQAKLIKSITLSS